MEAVYHDFCPVAMPCSRNLASARQMDHEDDMVLVKLNDTRRVAGYAWIPVADYARRHVWTNSRLRGR